MGGAGASVGSYWARAAASSHKKCIFMAALLSSRMAAHRFGVRPSEIFRRQETQRWPAHARQFGVAPSDRGVRHQPNLGRLVACSPVACVRGAPCVCLVAVDASWRPVELPGLGQPASPRARLGTSLSGFGPPLTAPRCSRVSPEPCIFEFELKPTSRIGRRALGAKECQLCSAPSARPQPKSSQNLL